MRFSVKAVILFSAIFELGVSETIQKDIIKLTDLFFENLREDPALRSNKNNDDLPEFSKNMIEKRVDNFINLLANSQNTLLQRGKRDLRYNDNKHENKSNFIHLSNFSQIPLSFLDDFQFFNVSKSWYLSAIRNGNNFSIYKYIENNSLSLNLSENIEYTTNIQLVSLEESTYFVVGTSENVNIFKFFNNEQQCKLEKIQCMDINTPKHLRIWYHLNTPFLSVTSNISNVENNENLNSEVRIYEWKGKHFDLIQKINSKNVQKTVHFKIDGLQYLVLVKGIMNSDNEKSYSEIFKQKLDNQIYELYQKVYTSNCYDLKFFQSFINGEKQYFLITSSSDVTVLYKFVENYFAPFQILEQNAFIQMQPIQDKLQNTALLGFSNYTTPKGFLYNEWVFSETKILQDSPYNDIGDFEPNIVHNFEINGKQILVISCKNCSKPAQILTINFTQADESKNIHSNLLQWCDKKLETIDRRSKNEVLVGEALRGDLIEDHSEEQQEIHQISAALAKVETVLYQMEQKIYNGSQVKKSDLLLQTNNFAQNIIFNAEVKIKNLTAKTLNKFNIENILKNKIDIEKGFEITQNLVQFETLVIEDTIQPKNVNGVNASQFLTVLDDIKFKNMEISGTANFENNLIVEKNLNGFKINKESLILNDVEQEFDEMKINDVSIDELNTQYLNDLNINGTINGNIRKISHLDKLKAQNITIRGYLNGISLPVLNQKCLKKTGDQNLNKTFYFDRLEVDHLNIKKDLDGKQIPDDFVNINAGEYSIDQDVEFTRGLNVNKLEVLKSLNFIEIDDDGNLNVLLTNSSKIQIISAKKDFEDIVLLNPIKLKNKIKNKQMEERNPIKLHNKNYEIERDVRIEGNVEVKRFLRVSDVFESSRNKSIAEVINNGIKLTDKIIPVSLNFLNPLVIEEIFAEKISNMVPENWLLKNSEIVQYVKGTKRFVKDLSLQGSTAVEVLNGIDTVLFEENIFNVDEDQDISGHWEFQSLVAENGTVVDHLDFGPIPWENVITTSNATTTIFGNVEANFILVGNSTKILGKFNNEPSITDLLKNVATKDTKFKIFGHKNIKKLYIKDLTYLENQCVKDMLDTITKSHIELDKNLFIKDMVVKDVIFENTLNNITKYDFDKIMRFGDNQSLEFDEEVFLDSLVVGGRVFIENDKINDVELKRLNEDTAKIDEECSFIDVTIESNVIAENGIIVNGNIENLDIGNIFNPDFENVLQNKVFLKDISIIGNAHVDGLINNVTNLIDFCEISQPYRDEKRIFKIKGDVMFAKGKGIKKLNNIDLKQLAKTIWITDEKTTLKSNLNLRNGVFADTLNVKGLVNNMNLSLISENYFSKTKDEKISGHLTFEDQVIFEKNVSTPKLVLSGEINDVSLDDFLRTAMLDGVDQVFEDRPYFEEIEIEGELKSSDFLVNNLDLANDVMRYDQHNVVTGRKVLKNLNVKYLNKGHKNITIKEVDLHSFIENVVLKNGTFKIQGDTVIDKAGFQNGLSVRGYVNSKNFTRDDVLLKNIPQTISGKKLFSVEGPNTLKFKSLKIKGLFNDLDIWDMVKNQAKKSTDLINIDSEVEFRKNIYTKNIIFEDTYNNMNISDILKNVSKLEALEQNVENYGNLLDMSLEIENSLKNQAKVFLYLKDIRYFSDTYESFGLQTRSGYLVLLTFGFVNGTNYYRSYEWVPYIRDFVYIGEYIESYDQPFFMKQIRMYDQDFLYIEHYNTEPPNNEIPQDHIQTTFIGRLLQLSNTSNFIEVARFPTNGTLSLVSMTLPGTNEECLAFVETDMRSINILCDENFNHQSYFLFDKIELGGVAEITAVSTTQSSYIFALLRPTPTYSESHVVILTKSLESRRFELVQAIFEAGVPTAVSSTVHNGEVLLAVTYAPVEVGAVDLGRVSIRKLDKKTNKFIPWQYISLTTPFDVSFMSIEPQEGKIDDPLLLISTNDVNSPLFGARYDGLAGFKSDFQGKGLPTGMKLRVVNENFILTLQPQSQEVILLKAECRGYYLNEVELN